MTSKLVLLILVGVLAGDFVLTDLHRSKRSLAFRKGSTFFYRLNYKVASVGWTNIFNQASGFKVSWHLPDGTHTNQKRSTYDVHEDIKFLYQSHGLDGQSCLARNICEAMRYAKREDGVIAKILKLLARVSNTNCTNCTDEEDDELECQRYRHSCPLQLISIDGFSV